jgi:hypothetical protein
VRRARRQGRCGEFETLTTHIFDSADPAADRGPIVGVKPEHLAEFRRLPPKAGRRCHALEVTLRLCPLGDEAGERPR